MNKLVTSLLFALLVGVAAAFFRPMAPYQVVEAEIKPALFLPRGGASMFDAGLDNPDIPEDKNISPARKCGFCMGVSVHMDE